MELHEAIGQALKKAFADKVIEDTPADTGKLKKNWRWYTDGKKWILENEEGEKVLYLEFGTGIYGKRRKPITPKKAKALHWVDRETGEDIFAKWVRGIEPRMFIRRNIYSTKNRKEFYKLLDEYVGEMLDKNMRLIISMGMKR